MVRGLLQPMIPCWANFPLDSWFFLSTDTPTCAVIISYNMLWIDISDYTYIYHRWPTSQPVWKIPGGSLASSHSPTWWGLALGEFDDLPNWKNAGKTTLETLMDGKESSVIFWIRCKFNHLAMPARTYYNVTYDAKCIKLLAWGADVVEPKSQTSVFMRTLQVSGVQNSCILLCSPHVFWRTLSPNSRRT